MKCPKCGYESNGRFCPACGTQIQMENLAGSESEILEPELAFESQPELSSQEPVQKLGLDLETDLQPESAGQESQTNQEPKPKPGFAQSEPGFQEAFYGGIPPRKQRGFGAFWRKNKRNKVLVIIAALILIAIIRSIIGGIGSTDLDSNEGYDWPTNDMAQMLPEPEGTITSVSTYNGDYLMADVDCTVDQYKDFVDGCKEKGFDKKQDVSQYEDDYDYSAENKDGYTLSADYYDGSLSIYLNVPEEEEAEETKKETKAEKKEKKETKAKDDGEVSADFKETMDDYEEFMNDYVEFMKKYESSDDTASMLVDYGKMMTKYSEFAEKIDAIDEDELSAADDAYYIEVMGRVNQKLAELY